MKTVLGDVVQIAKLDLFISVAKQLRTFLFKFQTDAPMAPYLILALLERLPDESLLTSSKRTCLVKQNTVFFLLKPVCIGNYAKASSPWCEGARVLFTKLHATEKTSRDTCIFKLLLEDFTSFL